MTAAAARSSRRARFGSVRLWRTHLRVGDAIHDARHDPAIVRVHFVISGEIEVGLGVKRWTVLTAAAEHPAIFVEANVPVAARATEESVVLTIGVPAEVTTGLELHPSVFSDRENRMVPPVVGFADAVIDGLGDASDAGTFAYYYIERLVQEMITGVLAERSVTAARRPGDIFETAMAVISARCADPHVSAGAVARDLNVSLRHLERAFQSRETTIAREIRRARVAQAVGLLADRSYKSLTIAAIARSCGFSSGSSLARAMAVEGRPSPGSIRQASAAVASVLPVPYA